MDAIFKDLISGGKVVVYLDDILIFTKTPQGSLKSPGNPSAAQPVPKTGEMWIWKVFYWVPWSGDFPQFGQYGSSKSSQSIWMASSN